MIFQITADADTPQKVLDGLNKRLTLGENMRAIEILISDTGSADVEFTVTHNLGKIPRHYLYNLDKGGVLYDSRRSEWTNEELYLKCTVSNCSATLTIL